MAVIDTALLELFDTGTRVFPVFPKDRPQPSDDPVVDGAEPGRYFGMAKVVPPAFQIRVEPGDDLLDAQPATAAGQLAYALFEA